MKKLSIIIPRYKETEQDIFPLITSIANQLAVNWHDIEIIIVNDGGGAGPLDEAFLSLFDNIDIFQIDLTENSGPGIARQAGIDEAEGEYLMFCDADDTLHNVGVLSAIFCEINAADNPDILVTKWLEEVKTDDGNMIYTTHGNDWTWMHGKIISREFVTKTGVRHRQELRVHEDSYFLNCLVSHNPRVQESDTISYVWKWRKDSITRRDDGAYSFNSLPIFLYATGLADAYIEDVNLESMPERIVYRACYIYHLTHSPAWIEDKHAEDVKIAEDAFAKEITPFWKYWKNASEGLRCGVYQATMNFAYGAIPSETLGQWLERLGLEY